jgi:hypothetical protein
MSWDINGVGTCGQTQACNDLKLADVPEMGVGLTSLLPSDCLIVGSTLATMYPTLVESESVLPQDWLEGRC